jgi:hypothetical protein
MKGIIMFKLMFMLIFIVGCAEINPSIEKIDETHYKIIGKLHKIEYDKIITIVEQHKNEQINFYVTSYGGTSEDLFEAMDAMYYHGNVHWYSINDCSSACAVMALSTRHAHGDFRLHSFYRRDKNRIIPAPEYNKKILKKLENYGYSTTNLQPMFYSVEEFCPITIDEYKITQ